MYMSKLNVKTQGSCYHRKWNVHLNMELFFPFGFIIFCGKGVTKKKKKAQSSTVFSLFSQMDSWLFTFGYVTLSHYWFAFQVTIKRLSVTIGFIQQVVSLPMKGIQVFITHSQPSRDIYILKRTRKEVLFICLPDTWARIAITSRDKKVKYIYLK